MGVESPIPIPIPIRVSELPLAHKLKRMSLPMPTKTKRISPPRNMEELPPKLGRKRIKLSPPTTPTMELPQSPPLPEEVIRMEILTRLPIKSVVRFKSVCKSWLSLFSDSQFIQHHTTRQNPNDYDCLVADKGTNIVVLSRYQETFVLRSLDYHLIGSAKGLVCLCCDNRMSLWNPAIHQSKEFDLPPLGYDCFQGVGLGFDPVNNDYKVVIRYRSVDLSHLCYAVYSSNSDSWIHHQFPTDYEILIAKFTESFTPTTVVKDCPYWTCYTTHSPDKNKVIISFAALKFDATSNKFMLLPEFSYDTSNEPGKTFKFVNMRDLLSLMAYEPCPTRKLDVYSLDEEKGCGVWSKMYSFGPFQQFRRFQDLQQVQQGFKYGDEIVFYEYGNIYRYDHKTGTFECIPGTEPHIFKDCFTYTPTLASLQGMKSIYSENQTPPLCHHSTAPLRLISSLRDKSLVYFDEFAILEDNSSVRSNVELKEL